MIDIGSSTKGVRDERVIHVIVVAHLAACCEAYARAEAFRNSP